MTRLIFLTLIGLLFTGKALACSCVPYTKDVQAHIDETDAIFEGTVIKTETVSGHPFKRQLQQTHFKVTRVWKGKVPAVVGVYHEDPSIDSCGYVFDPGYTGRIFAERMPYGLYTGVCHGPWFEWAEYGAILGKGRKVE